MEPEKTKAICVKCGTEADTKLGDPSEYECAKCGSQVIRFSLETATIAEMEIFRAGLWKGRNYTVKDLDQVIANFEAGYIRPYLYVSPSGDHDQTDHGARPMLSALAHRWVEKLWRVGDRLKAKIKQVPKAIAELIESGALKQKSVELWPDFPTTDGMKHGAALEAILMFGRGLPAVYDLDDAVTVYYTVDRTPSDDKKVIDVDGMRDGSSAGTTAKAGSEEHKKQRPAPGGVTAGNKETEERKMSEELTKLRAEVEALERTRAEVTIEKLKADHGLALQKMQTERDAARADAEKAKTEVVAVRREQKRADIQRFVVSAIEKRQIEPASKDATIEHILDMEEAKATEYMKRMEKLPALFTDAVVPTTEPTEEFKDESKDEAVRKANAIEMKAIELQKKSPNLSAREALDKARAEVG